MAIVKGDKIKVEYEGSFEGGEVFDSSDKHGQPLEFEAGAGKVVKGFDNAVIGMEVGEEKEVTLKPEDAYGMPDPRAVQRVPKRMMPPDVEVGSELGIPLDGGQTMPAKVIEIVGDMIKIDMNHPLAGKTLIFKIKIVE